ncbi:MAG: hypothetical protein O7D34_05600, partial [Ignavibacteria bacterium]|nr:hypothetical protein [Ignavibacteria bacterium]
DGKFSVFVKDAYLRWKSIFQGSDFFFGIHPTPAFQVSQKEWSYRSLEKTIMDLRKVVSSRDLGLALKGKLDKGGIFNYWVMVANGRGNKPELDKHKRYYLTFHVKPTKNLTMSLYVDYADRGKTVDKYTKATVSNGTLTSAAFVGYAEKKNFSVGIEGFLSTGLNQFDDGSSIRDLRTIGISVFGSVHLVSQVVLVGRYDYYDPNINGGSKGDSRHYILGAVAWKPDDNVSIMPNVQVETYETTAGSIDPSVTGRVTFYYVFLQ